LTEIEWSVEGTTTISNQFSLKKWSPRFLENYFAEVRIKNDHKSFLRDNLFEMSNLFSSLLYDTTVFTFHTIAQLQRHLVADLFWYSGVPTYTFTIHSLSRVVVPAALHSKKEIKTMFHSILCRFLSAFLKIYWQISMCDFGFFPNVTAENHPPTKWN
jgi:hypothetical protein